MMSQFGLISGPPASEQSTAISVSVAENFPEFQPRQSTSTASSLPAAAYTSATSIYGQTHKQI